MNTIHLIRHSKVASLVTCFSIKANSGPNGIMKYVGGQGSANIKLIKWCLSLKQTNKQKVYLMYCQRIIVAQKSVHCTEDLKKKEDCSISWQ